MSNCDETEKAASSSLIRCKFGPIEAVAKVCTLESLVTLTYTEWEMMSPFSFPIFHSVTIDSSYVMNLLRLPFAVFIIRYVCYHFLELASLHLDHSCASVQSFLIFNFLWFECYIFSF